MQASVPDPSPRQGGLDHCYLDNQCRSFNFCGMELAERGSRDWRDEVKPVVNKSYFCADDCDDIFDMSSFFTGHDLVKNDADLILDDGHNESSDTVAEMSDSCVDSVVMGIPYYVACQWQQMQQTQQQQQQAVMMLWWQAYLSGAYTMLGPKAMSGATQLGWSLPSAGLAAIHGAYADLDKDSFYQQMLMVEDKSNGTKGGTKRRRKTEGGCNGPNQPNGKKGRRPRHDERVCKNCGTNETPFWRKDKQDGLPLCNACGLYLSKNDAPRPKVLWKPTDRATTGSGQISQIII